MNTKIKLIALFAGLAASASAGYVSLSDDNIAFTVNGASLAVGTYETRWGTFASGTFTPFLGAAVDAGNGGYYDVGSNYVELAVSLSQGDNVSVAAGLPMALSISILADDSSYAGATNANQVILTDAAWVVPTFTLLSPEGAFAFSAGTSRALLTGQNPATSFSFNGGAEVINLVTTAVPEPSTYAAFAGLAVLGLAASRRRRQA